MKNKILFLGVTNHCASRFAEVIFNHLAGEQLLNYHSCSRGIQIQHQPDPIDPRTTNALIARGVLMTANPRHPQALQPGDLRESDYIVLISGQELSHRLDRARGIEGKQILTWEFNQVDTIPAHALYPALEAEVFLLIRRLHLQQHPYPDRITA